MKSYQITYPYKTHSIKIEGNCEIAYMDEGTGPKTLLFIHGLANYAPVWKKCMETLKADFRCIAIDLPGNGLSDQNGHNFSMSFFADTIYNFIEELNLKNVTIVGHSMGGQVAMTTVLKYPDCAERLILCAPAGFEQFTAVDKTMYYGMLHLIDMVASDELSLRKTIEASFFKPQPQVDLMIKELSELIKSYKGNYYKKMVEGCIRSMLEDAVFDKVQLIKQKTLVVYGNRDALIPNKLIHHITTEKLAGDAVAKMQDAQLKIINDCGHFVQWERADELNQFIKAFMQTV